jgi:hypothetical protein
MMNGGQENNAYIGILFEMWKLSVRTLRLRSATLRVIGPVRGERSPEGEVEAGTALLIHKSIRKAIVALVSLPASLRRKPE